MKPDRAEIVVGVTTRAATAADAASRNARRQSAIIGAIKARGVSADDIATSGYSITPELRYRDGDSPLVTGFVVSNEVSVTVRSIEMVGSIIDTTLASGANQINSLAFGIANPDSARRVALAVAVARARLDANVMAQAAGGALGQLLELTSTEESQPIPRPMLAMSRAAGANDATPIESGEQAVRASVTARWQFVAKEP